jgi:hypothetical protein
MPMEIVSGADNPFNPYILVAYDINDVSKGGEMSRGGIQLFPKPRFQTVTVPGFGVIAWGVLKQLAHQKMAEKTLR